MIKVLFFANIPSPYRVDFFNALAEKCDLTVVYERRSASDRDDKWKTAATDKYRTVFLDGIKYSGDFAVSFKYAKLIKEVDYDIIVVSGYASITQMLTIRYLHRHKIPFILNVDGGILRPESRAKYRLKRSFVTKASGYLSTGSECDKFLMHYGAEHDKLYRYPFTGLHDADIFARPLSSEEKAGFKKKIGCNSDRMILTVGRIIPSKGLDLLIKVMKDLPGDVSSYVVGGEPTEDLKELMSDLGVDNVHFISFKHGEELKDYYRAADVFFFPTRTDVWGLVVNEAMSVGLPVITTDKCNAGLELVKDGINGFIVPNEGTERMRETLKRVLESDSYKMGQASIDTIKDYTIEKMAERHIKIFKDFLGKE